MVRIVPVEASRIIPAPNRPRQSGGRRGQPAAPPGRPPADDLAPNRHVIFQRSLLREFGNYAAAVFSVLFAIVVTSQLVRMLARAAGGKIPYRGDPRADRLHRAQLPAGPARADALRVGADGRVAQLPRLRDGRLVRLRAVADRVGEAGADLRRADRAPDHAARAVPDAVGERARRRVPAQPREPRGRVADRARACSASRRTPSGCSSSRASDGQEDVVRNVFVASNQRGRSGVIGEPRGLHRDAPNGDRFAVLLNGRRYDGIPGTGEYRVIEFERYAARIKAREARAASQRPKTAPTLELLESPEPRTARGADVADRTAARRAQPRAARDPARLRQPAREPVDQPHVRGVHLHGLQQPARHREGLGRAGTGAVRDRLVGGARGDALLSRSCSCWRNTLGFKLVARR